MKLSRSKIDLFLECPRCFYLDVVRKIKRPPGFPFTLNNAVDTLLKKEFDAYRQQGLPHPLMVEHGVNAVPANHSQLNNWRNSLGGGISYLDPASKITFYGGIDDLWVSPTGEYHVVDYKATAKETPVTTLPEWAIGYRRQVEFYQWLLRQNGLNVSDTAYFVYATGKTTEAAFNNRIEFHCHLIPYTGSDKWIPSVLTEVGKNGEFSKPSGFS